MLNQAPCPRNTPCLLRKLCLQMVISREPLVRSSPRLNLWGHQTDLCCFLVFSAEQQRRQQRFNHNVKEHPLQQLHFCFCLTLAAAPPQEGGVHWFLLCIPHHLIIFLRSTVAIKLHSGDNKRKSPATSIVVIGVVVVVDNHTGDPPPRQDFVHHL